jgi:PAS domain S-box-containing protein
MSDAQIPSHDVAPADAAADLGLESQVLKALVMAGLLTVQQGRLSATELEALKAVKDGPRKERQTIEAAGGYHELLEELENKIDDLAGQTFERFSQTVAEARQWPAPQREGFIAQARGRFDAVLAVVDKDLKIEEALVHDLEMVGANAAGNGSSLHHILLVLRISRDLLVKAALDVARTRKTGWDGAVREFVSRVMPAIDRLADSITQGYWKTRLARSGEVVARLENIFRDMPLGAYEADVDGVVTWANPALSSLLGRSEADVVGRRLNDLFHDGASGALGALYSEASSHRVSLVAQTPTGVVPVEVDTVLRRSPEGTAVAFAGVVQPAARPEQLDRRAEIDLESLTPQIDELRRSLEILRQAGAFLVDKADALQPAHVGKAGDSIQKQVDRLLGLVDALSVV